MGHNSTDALRRFLHDYLKQCKVVNNIIVTPDEERFSTPDGGGHKLPRYDQGYPESGAGDMKRGQ